MKRICKTEAAYMKGSYTVEAAIVMSLVFFVLSAMIFCAFYLHDRAVFQSSACEIAAVGSNFATLKERQEAVAKAKKKITAKRFMGSRNPDGSASAGKNETTSSWTAVFPIPGFAAKYLAGGKITIQKTWSAEVLDPADTIRKITGAANLIGAGK